MSRITVFSLFSILGFVALAPPAAAQPSTLTSANGCDVFVRLEGELELQPFGHVGTLLMQKAGSGQLVTFVFECIDFPTEPEAVPDGILRSVSICNWRMKENGVKGTNRAEVRWFPDPLTPGQFEFSNNAQVMRGTRYPHGVVSARGMADLITGTITLDSFTAVLCRGFKDPKDSK